MMAGAPMREGIAAVLAIAVGIAALVGTRSMSSLGSVFPTTAATVMIVAALAVLARAVLRSRRAEGASAAPTATVISDGAAPTLGSEPQTLEEAPAGALPQGFLPRFVGASIALVGWAVALKPVGFLVTGALGLIAFALLARRERMTARSILLHALAGTVLLVGFYLLMAEVLLLAVP